MQKTFPAKKDALVKYLIIFSMMMTLPVFFLEGIPLYIEIAVVGIFGFVFWAWFKTMTIVDGNQLVHRSGPITWRVDISTITKIKRKGTSMINHGTWSMDKMDIHHKGSTISIAPENKDELIKLLKKINKNIKVI